MFGVSQNWCGSDASFPPTPSNGELPLANGTDVRVVGWGGGFSVAQHPGRYRIDGVLADMHRQLQSESSYKVRLTV